MQVSYLLKKDTPPSTSFRTPTGWHNIFNLFGSAHSLICTVNTWERVLPHMSWLCHSLEWSELINLSSSGIDSDLLLNWIILLNSKHIFTPHSICNVHTHPHIHTLTHTHTHTALTCNVCTSLRSWRTSCSSHRRGESETSWLRSITIFPMH